ncbi:MAG: efflux RND transporter permease subunit, partial [Candidatus Binatia bacterium]
TTEFLVGAGPVFGAVLILIYLLAVAWFQSFTIPLVILVPIPLSLIGIVPLYALVGAFVTGPTAIGFMGGAGIVVRNSIILVDFIELRRKQGMPLAEAVVEAGAIRFRPMLLTALAVVVGSAVLLLDPIFQGMALSLMGGEVAATALSRVVVPVLYYMSERRHEAALLKSSATVPPSTSVPNTGVPSLQAAGTNSPSSGDRFARHE